MLPKHVLVVEDEVVTQRFITNILKNYEVASVVCVDNGIDALTALQEADYDAVLVDINLSGAMDGIRLAERVTKKYDICLMFITAYNDRMTVDEALSVAPYGYIMKPFSADDLIITLQFGYKRFLLDRKEGESNEASDVPQSNKCHISKNIVFVYDAATLYIDGEPVSLTMKQTKLIALLCRNLNYVVSHETILADVWGDQEATSASLRTLVYTLRKNVPRLPIVSFNKLGYMLKSVDKA